MLITDENFKLVNTVQTEWFIRSLLVVKPNMLVIGYRSGKIALFET